MNLPAALFPDVCLACGLLLRALPAPLPLCSRCAPEVTPLAPEQRCVDGVIALFAYEGPLAAVLARLKFAGDAALAGPLGRLLAGAPELLRRPGEGPPPWDLIAPIPLHPWRALRRGYNQSALLARWLARAWPTEHAPRLSVRLLRRTRAAPPQTQLDRQGRQANLRGAFALRAGQRRGRGRRGARLAELAGLARLAGLAGPAKPRGPTVRGLRILLVDDVTTTGSTFAAGRAALRSAGAAEVTGLALLRTLP